MSDQVPWGDTPCTPGDAEWNRRLAWFVEQPVTGWWWLSFADPDAPPGSQFLGLCLVPGGNIVQASTSAHTFGCNPGGEIAGWPLPRAPRSRYRCTLFTGGDAHAVAALPMEEVLEDR